jgi:hypothetical protein
MAELTMDLGETIALVNPKAHQGPIKADLGSNMTEQPAAKGKTQMDSTHVAPTQTSPRLRITRSMSRSPCIPTNKTPVTSPRKPAASSGEIHQQPPTATSRSSRRSRDRLPEDTQNWRVRAEYASRFTEKLGPFDVDACCDFGGQNRQVDRFWTDCLSEKWRGLRVWCNPPYNSSHITVEAILQKYIPYGPGKR